MKSPSGIDLINAFMAAGMDGPNAQTRLKLCNRPKFIEAEVKELGLKITRTVEKSRAIWRIEWSRGRR